MVENNSEPPETGVQKIKIWGVSAVLPADINESERKKTKTGKELLLLLLKLFWLPFCLLCRVSLLVLPLVHRLGFVSAAFVIPVFAAAKLENCMGFDNYSASGHYLGRILFVVMEKE